jgi:hypothetical protein
MPVPFYRSEEHDLADLLQGIALGLLIVFFGLLLKMVLPLALLQPAWQLRAADALRATSSVALLAVSLLMLAPVLSPDAPGLGGRVLWVRRLAILAALGFVLLVPLQISAVVREVGQTTAEESRRLRVIERVEASIARANSPDAIISSIAQIPGLPLPPPAAFNRPIPELRNALLAQLRPEIRSLEQRLAQLRRERLQSAIFIQLLDSLAALGYATAFAAVARTGQGKPTLLQSLIWLPHDLRRLCANALGRLQERVEANRDRLSRRPFKPGGELARPGLPLLDPGITSFRPKPVGAGPWGKPTLLNRLQSLWATLRNRFTNPGDSTPSLRRPRGSFTARGGRSRVRGPISEEWLSAINDESDPPSGAGS